ncbi:hypothetical protein ACFZ8E_07595 [Methylobacterium sp. HMF5984]|uniref:hypothetical protein n=1 Tax=Methylobacterium sp. HMF5984 TaxID=3367370 RepID=UPI003853660E
MALNIDTFKKVFQQLAGDNETAHENAGRTMGRMLNSAKVHPSDVKVSFAGDETDLAVRMQGTIDGLARELNAASAVNRPLRMQVAAQKNEILRLKKLVAEGLEREKNLIAAQSIRAPNKSELMSKLESIIDEAESGGKMKEDLARVTEKLDYFQKECERINGIRKALSDENEELEGQARILEKTIDYMESFLSDRVIELCRVNGTKYANESEIVGDLGWLRRGKAAS